jgi:aspartate carbamoyltransferase regulatory subunit
MSNKDLVVRKIENGTVIDHITPGKGHLVVKILRLGPDAQYYLAQNVPSVRMGRKDLVKIADRYPTEHELNTIALIAPKATIDRVKDWTLYGKFQVKVPSDVMDVIRCPNGFCITNHEKGMHTEFTLIETDAQEPVLQCSFCECLVEFAEVESHLLV